MQSTKEFIGSFILFVRENLGVSRNQLATDLEISYQNLWDVEAGSRCISTAKLDELISKLNLSPIEFWGMVPKYLRHLEKLKTQQN